MANVKDAEITVQLKADKNDLILLYRFLKDDCNRAHDADLPFATMVLSDLSQQIFEQLKEKDDTNLAL